MDDHNFWHSFPTFPTYALSVAQKADSYPIWYDLNITIVPPYLWISFRYRKNQYIEWFSINLQCIVKDHPGSKHFISKLDQYFIAVWLIRNWSAAYWACAKSTSSEWMAIPIFTGAGVPRMMIWHIGKYPSIYLTSWHGNAFRVIGPWWWESTWGLSPQRVTNAGFWCW